MKISKFNWEYQVLHEIRLEYLGLIRDRSLALKPAALSLTDSESRWAFFDPNQYTLYFSRKLLTTQPWSFIRGVLKHEVAHQWLFEKDPVSFSERPHGPEFQIACKRIGVPNPFNQAKVHETAFQEDSTESSDGPNSRVLERVKKLLSLAQSSQQHEAQMAMAKAQQLMALHNLESFKDWSRDSFCHKLIRTEKQRLSAWQSKILSILMESFFVEVILIQELNTASLKRVQTIELLGTRENVEFAHYAYHFLCQQLEGLMKSYDLSGRTQKMSYRLGVLEGFSQKLKRASSPSLQGDHQRQSSIQRALIKFESEPELKSYLKEIYPRLHSRRSSSRIFDESLYSSGFQDGQKIVLSRPLEGKNSSSKTERIGRSKCQP
jgi:hypothetical protein